MLSKLQFRIALWVSLQIIVVAALMGLLDRSPQTQVVENISSQATYLIDGEPEFIPEGFHTHHGYMITTLTPGESSTFQSANLAASLEIIPLVDIARLEVGFGTTGSATGQTETLVFNDVAAGQNLNIPATFSVQGGNGQLFANITAIDADNVTFQVNNPRIYYFSAHNTVFFDNTSLMQAELASVASTLESGMFVAENAAVANVLGSGAMTDIAEVMPNAGPGDITVQGQIQWTDSAGGQHPARFVTVEVRDADLVGSELITTVETDANGEYSATFANDNGALEGGYDIFIRVLTRHAGFDVKVPGSLLTSPTTHRIDSSEVADVADGTRLTINLTAVDITRDNIRAFSVHDALVTAYDYVASIRGSGLPNVEVLFPRSGSYYSPSNNNLHIQGGDHFDWDVIHHEYGHYVQSQLGIARSPGGAHALHENLAEPSRTPLLGKDAGTRLAWGEGWPTYFGTVLQQEMGTAAWGIPNVGDLRYTETDESNFSYSLELTDARDQGEDNELVVQRILFDMYDAASDSGDDRGVAMSDTSIWNTIDAGNPTRLDAAYKALTAGQSPRDVANIGCIMAEHGVAPELVAPSDNIRSGTNAPTFEWRAQGGGPTYRNDKFVVDFYNEDFTTLVFSSSELTTTTYTPSAAEWQQIIEDSGVLTNWVVRGQQTSTPATGWYTSCSRTIVHNDKIDLVFVIDTTGSMVDDIAEFQAAAIALTNQIDETGRDYRIGGVLYKDHGDTYVSQVGLDFSSDAPTIVAAINSITVFGGGDYPEAVYSGVMTAIGLTWREEALKSIILMGDAPPKDPEPVTGYTLAQVLAAAATGDVNTPLLVGNDVSLSSRIEMPTGEDMPSQTSTYAEDVIRRMPAGSVLAEHEKPALSVLSIRMYPVLIGSDEVTRIAFESLADGTGGDLFNAEDADEVVEVLGDVLETLFAGPLEAITPQPNATITEPVTVLRWGEDPTASWYGLWVLQDGGVVHTAWFPATDAEAAKYGLELPGICEQLICEVSAPPLVNGSYDWWLTTWNEADGIGDYKSASFTLDVGPVGFISRISPYSYVGSPDEMLAWRPDPNALWYNLLLVDSAGKTVYNQWVPQSDMAGMQGVCDSERCAVPLPVVTDNETYDWWIAGWGPAGLGDYNERSFLVDLEIPDAIVQLDVTESPFIDVQWQQDYDALWYHVYITGDNGIVVDEWYDANTVCDEFGLCTVSLPPVTNGTYEWSMAGWSPVGLGPYNTLDFVIDLPAPDTLENQFPTTDIELVDAYFPLSWTASEVTAWYNVVITGPDGYSVDEWYNPNDICADGVCRITVPAGIEGDYTWQLAGWGPGGLGPTNEISFSFIPPPPIGE